MINLGFTLEATKLITEQTRIESPISGKKVMFTGKMNGGSRSEMQAEARTLGAVVLSSISAKLEILVIGEKPSPNKVSKAENLGIEIVSEREWRTRLEG